LFSRLLEPVGKFDKADNGGEKDKGLIERIGININTLPIEHLVYTFYIKGISRGFTSRIGKT